MKSVCSLSLGHHLKLISSIATLQVAVLLHFALCLAKDLRVPISGGDRGKSFICVGEAHKNVKCEFDK